MRSSNGIDAKRHRKRDSVGSAGGGGVTPPLATIAAASGSPGHASALVRKGGLVSAGSYEATENSPSDGYGHAHYVALASGARAGESDTNKNGKALTPSPSPPIGTTGVTAITGASTSTSMPSTTSGSLGLHPPAASPASSPPPSLSVPSSRNRSSQVFATSTSSVSGFQFENSFDTRGLKFVHYNFSTPGTQPDRVIPPLNTHPHPQPQPRPHSHPNSPRPHSNSQSPSGIHPSLPGYLSTGHHVYSGYTTRPSPLSQAGNIVTGPGAAGSGVGAGLLTPLSSAPPHSAIAETSSNTAEENVSTSGNDIGNGMQLPPLAHMDRLVHSGSSQPHYGSLMGMKLDYGTSPELDSPVNDSGVLQQHGTLLSSVNREPLTPLSAESPIESDVGRGHQYHHNHQHAANARTALGGGQ